MIDIIKDTLMDSLKLIPFLFCAFLIMEFIEHKLSNKSKKVIEKSGKYGPFLGSILGAFPQCGFSVAATNLYATRIISVGTLIAIYLSTSDEMLPILISQNVDAILILEILGLKVAIGMICGVFIDYILRNKKQSKHNEIKDFCEEEHCHCDHGIILPTIKHTLNILLFITIVTFLLNLGIEYLGEENIAKIFMKDSFVGPFISSLIGLIPNCASSVVITELYLTEAITFGSAMAGLLTGAGVGLLILFKVNKNMKDNFKILFTVYGIGVVVGIIIDLIGMIL